jgi:ferrous iron transport protein A
MKQMNTFKVGDRIRVTGFDSDGRAYRKRLLAMGLTPGTEFTIDRFAPMGDPIIISIRGYKLSIRSEELQALLLDHVDLCKGCHSCD